MPVDQTLVTMRELNYLLQDGKLQTQHLALGRYAANFTACDLRQTAS